ncbi:MAG: hypothetical protein LC772_11275, partial [Chloroflexi bacterium]|nr:hypothetical protein [Chloroflexota bacterium]
MNNGRIRRRNLRDGALLKLRETITDRWQPVSRQMKIGLALAGVALGVGVATAVIALPGSGPMN